MSDFFISVEYHFLPDRISYLRLTALSYRHSYICFRSSHPIACDGCYHARTVAGGESQLSVVIANQVLLDFSEDGIARASFYKIEFVMESWRTLLFGYCGKFVISEDYSVDKEPAHHTELNCYHAMWRIDDFISLHLFPHNSVKSKGTYKNFFKIFSRFFRAVRSVSSTACFVHPSISAICSSVSSEK